MIDVRDSPPVDLDLTRQVCQLAPLHCMGDHVHVHAAPQRSADGHPRTRPPIPHLHTNRTCPFIHHLRSSFVLPCPRPVPVELPVPVPSCVCLSVCLPCCLPVSSSCVSGVGLLVSGGVTCVWCRCRCARWPPAVLRHLLQSLRPRPPAFLRQAASHRRRETCERANAARPVDAMTGTCVGRRIC